MTLYLGDKQIAGTLKGEINNPYSLLESKYSELEITNSSWLKSNKQWNSKEMYPSVWEKLHQPKYFAWKVDNYDDKYGVIGTKLATPQHNDIVYQLVAGEIDGVYYDVGAIRGYVWNTIETPDSEEIIAITIHDNTGTLSTIELLNRNSDYDILLAKKRTEPFTKYDFVVNEENERFMLPIETKTSFVIDEGEENGIKYRIWNDGYCEQEGVITGTGTQTVSLIKNYSDISWNFTYGHSYTALLADSRILLSSTKSTNSFQLIMGTTSLTIYWKASGYLASDQYTPQNLYYYVGDTVQNASLIDVAQVTSALSNKVDITSELVSNNRFDGQWQMVDYTITSSGSAGTFNFNISDLVGNNTYCYEVLISSWFYSDSSTYRAEFISSSLCSEIQFGHNGTNNRSAPNTFTIPVGSDHIITFRASYSFTNREFKIASYRRIGTNE